MHSRSTLFATFAVVWSYFAIVIHSKPLDPRNATFTEFSTLYIYTDKNGTESYSFGNNNHSARSNGRRIVSISRNPMIEGWDYIQLEAHVPFHESNNNKTSLSSAYYAVGYAEGYLTADGIFSSFYNSVQPIMSILSSSPCYQSFFNQQMRFMEDLSNTSSSEGTQYGAQLKNQLKWLHGLHEGYTAGLPHIANTSKFKPAPAALSFEEIFMTSYFSEVSHAYHAACPNHTASATTDHLRPRKGHCSAFIRATSDDLFVAHATWANYNMMLRQLKTYKGLGATITMTSYPGSFSSIDDWYVTSNGLAVTETSIPTLKMLDRFVPSESVPEFMRVMLANFLAANGEEWARLFSKHNSGTYNNQYMIVDMKIAEKRHTTISTSFPPKTFFVLEQTPGLIVWRDETNHLNTYGYWASFNIPHFNETYEREGFLEAYENYGDYYSRTQYARPRIFAAKQATATNLSAIAELMQYNEYLTDAEGIIPWCIQSDGFTGKRRFNCTAKSMRSGCLGVAARCDLAPQEFELTGYPSLASDIGRGLWGAIDYKITKLSWMSGSSSGGNRTGLIHAGPTCNPAGCFSWSSFAKANANNSILVDQTPHRQIVDSFDYGEVLFSV